MAYLTREPIDPSEWHRQSSDPADGAVVEFLGIVRGQTNGRQTSWIDYEAYAPMAESVIAGLIEEATVRWLLHRVYVRHRLGRVEVGGIAILIGVHAPHRDQAFEACRFLIDRIKEETPIWKREHYADGSVEYGACEHAAGGLE